VSLKRFQIRRILENERSSHFYSRVIFARPDINEPPAHRSAGGKETESRS